MSYIDQDYFINEISLPNTANEQEIANITSALNKYEKQCLISILGHKLYDLMADDDSPPRFQEIINGASFTFTFEGKSITRKWIGLVNTEKESLIAYYTYFHYLRNKNTFTTGVGNVTPKVENSEQDNPILKLVNAYNVYINMRGDFYKRGVYASNWAMDNLGNELQNQNNYEHYNTDPSLYNFLLANLSTYPEWVFTVDKKINEFNI